jgi:hypothetical protein
VLVPAAPASDGDQGPAVISAVARGTPRCTPSKLNTSDVLPGTTLAASPLPGARDASPAAQISLLGAPAGAIGPLHVTGSRTGSHGGRLLAYSQGDGASFLPARPFAAGEIVTVRGSVGNGSAQHSFAYRFTVAYPDHSLATLSSAHVANDQSEVQHFTTRPDLKPPVAVVTSSSPTASGGDIFTAPYSGPGPSGPEIFDPSGALVWFDPMPAGLEAANLQVQDLNGAPVLTWWQGRIPPQGFGEGEDVIESTSYQRIGTVHAGNGHTADLHEFHITPEDTAVLTVFDPIYCNLSSAGGSAKGAVTASLFQEIDLKTGLVRREWNPLDHIPLSSSYSSDSDSSARWPFDYFHLNSIDQQANGQTLISARNTSALYELNTVTGRVLTDIGGRHSTVRLGAGAATAYQHDANVLANGTIGLFDNEGSPRVRSQSRGLVIAVNPAARTDDVRAQYEHPSPIASASQGSFQQLPNGDLFIGWGGEPYFSEFTAAGKLVYDAHWHGSYQSYRAYRFEWTGSPTAPPSIVAITPGGAAPMTVDASWNGDTRTASWRVLAGSSPTTLTAVATAPRAGIETSISVPGAQPYVAVQALSASGEPLGTSGTITPRR